MGVDVSLIGEPKVLDGLVENINAGGRHVGHSVVGLRDGVSASAEIDAGGVMRERADACVWHEALRLRSSYDSCCGSRHEELGTRGQRRCLKEKWQCCEEGASVLTACGALKRDTGVETD